MSEEEGPAVAFVKMYDPPAWHIEAPFLSWPLRCQAARVASDDQFQELYGRITACVATAEDRPAVFGSKLGGDTWVIVYGVFTEELVPLWNAVDALLAEADRDWITPEDLDWFRHHEGDFLRWQEQAKPN